jgi:beta-lactam-binding protein with PASTA domain
MVAVPSVVGDTQAAAKTAITGSGLVVGTVALQSAGTTFVASTDVVSESPAAGTSVASGTSVNLVVSRGATYAYTFSACIDGSDFLVIQGSQIQWQYGNSTSVGDLLPDCGPTTTMIQTSVNGTPVQTADWQPIWSPDPPASGALSSPFAGLSPALPVSAMTVTLTTIAARGSLSIYQTPTAENNWALILWFNDAAVGGAAMYSGQVTVSGTAVKLPNVVGATQAAATTAITDAGLVRGWVAQYWSSTVAPGDVLSESPAAGTSAASGAPVNLVLSSGVAPIVVAVPNVTALTLLPDTQAAATTVITNAGLVVGTVTQSASIGCCGQIISETPAAGTR